MRLYLLLCALGLLGCSSHLTYVGLYTHAFLVTLCGFALLGLLKTWDKRPTDLGHNCKQSKCCPGELLVPLHSTNTKICTGCKLEQPWPLEAGQKRTFD